MIAALTGASLLLPQGAGADDELVRLRAERDEITRQVELLRRNIPLPAGPDEIRDMLLKPARSAELELALGEFAAPERLLFPDGDPSPIELVRVGVEGTDRFGDLAFFLSMLRYSGRIVQLESMRIVAEGAGAVRFSARLTLPQYAGDVPGTARPTGRDPAAALRAQIEAARELRDLFLEIVDQKRPEIVIEALEVLAKRGEESAIALREVRFDRELVIDGVVVGAKARAALRDALEGAPLQLLSLEIPDAGLCRSFVVKARVLAPNAESDEIVVDNGLFDGSADARCERTSTGVPKKVNVRGSDPLGIAVKLRDADLAAAFRVLAESTGANFVLDHDLTGRVELVVEGATLDATLNALGEAGVSVGPPPLRRVTRKNAAVETSNDKFVGEPVSISLQHADLADFLCAFSNISGLTIRVPAGLERDVSIFASEMEWDRVLDGVFAAQRLQHELRNDSILIGTEAKRIDPSALVETCADSSASSQPSRLSALGFDVLDSSDIVLDGLSRTKDGWKAWIEMTDGILRPLEPGKQLVDGRVDAIDESGVTIVGAGGKRRRIPFNTLR